MLRDGKNLKDSNPTTSISITDKVSAYVSYTKTDKLITALYMVTDIMDKEEPLRNKLRTLGADVMSDMHSVLLTQSHLQKVLNRVEEIVSFLDLSQTLNVISIMNANILKKEFLELREAVLSKLPSLEEIFTELAIESSKMSVQKKVQIGKIQNARPRPVNLGVQKAGNFLDVLSDRVTSVSNRNFVSDKVGSFNDTKQTRREEILKVIRHKSRVFGLSNGLTITDIIGGAKDLKGELNLTILPTCGEKTLQRELVSLVQENVLQKTGSKRWSRYALA